MTHGPEERPLTGAVLTRSLLTFVAPTPERVHRSGAGPGSTDKFRSLRNRVAVAAQSQFQLVRQELAETIHLNETIGAPSARATEKLNPAFSLESAGPEAAPRSEFAPSARQATLKHLATPIH
jgi:hypothetical protein